MKICLRTALVLLIVASVSAAFAGIGVASEAQRHVVGGSEIQARFDAKVSQSDADREAIRSLLRRPEVRQIAGAAGLDIVRADAATATLSDARLKDLAAQAREVDSQLAGGSVVIISTTLIIIILLLIILL